MFPEDSARVCCVLGARKIVLTCFRSTHWPNQYEPSIRPYRWDVTSVEAFWGSLTGGAYKRGWMRKGSLLCYGYYSCTITRSSSKGGPCLWMVQIMTLSVLYQGGLEGRERGNGIPERSPLYLGGSPILGDLRFAIPKRKN